MSTHHPGTVYRDWQRMDGAAQRLLAELAVEQVTHVDLVEYQPGSPHLERLLVQIAEAQRFTWPATFTVNV